MAWKSDYIKHITMDVINNPYPEHSCSRFKIQDFIAEKDSKYNNIFQCSERVALFRLS